MSKKYGDLITYPHLLYTHYAVYTGKNEKGQEMGVEFTGEKGPNSKAGAAPRQGPLKEGGIVNNSLDEIMRPKLPQSEDKMRAAVQEILKNPQKYKLLENNCEHLATYVRYGERHSEQANRVLRTEPYFNNEIAGNLGASFFPRLS